MCYIYPSLFSDHDPYCVGSSTSRYPCTWYFVEGSAWPVRKAWQWQLSRVFDLSQTNFFLLPSSAKIPVFNGSEVALSSGCRSSCPYVPTARIFQMGFRTKAVVGTPTPSPHISDEEMQEAPQSDGENLDNEIEEQNPVRYDDEEEEEVERLGTPVNDSDTASHVSTPGRAQRGSALRRRRAGRPPKIRNLDRDTPDDSGAGTSDKGTPRKRGGWRGGPRGSGHGRWGKPKGGPSHISQARTDVHNDEVDVPEDPDGETKVDKSGNLLGNREYRVRVFTIVGKESRLYMLSTEPARCIGFRDSYLFFQKHPNLYKIIVDDEAKRDMIARDILPHSYKGRSIGVVTARSVFREFGAKIVIGGKKVVDDYQVAAAKARGDVEGELAVPDDQIPAGGKQLYDRNQYVAWHGASSVYHTNQPSMPLINGKGPDGKKRKIVVTGDNWMFEHAQAAR